MKQEISKENSTLDAIRLVGFVALSVVQLLCGLLSLFLPLLYTIFPWVLVWYFFRMIFLWNDPDTYAGLTFGFLAAAYFLSHFIFGVYSSVKGNKK